MARLFLTKRIGELSGHSVFELNLKEWETYRCARMKASEGPEAEIFLGQELIHSICQMLTAC